MRSCIQYLLQHSGPQHPALIASSTTFVWQLLHCLNRQGWDTMLPSRGSWLVTDLEEYRGISLTTIEQADHPKPCYVLPKIRG